ncbi:MAG: SusD/RagB family nutrient-binding outer membrane lipoprotein [Gemmatimonadaceae bacterium]
MNKYLKGAICAAVLTVVASGCNNFLKSDNVSKDPNNPLQATPKQFFGSVQSNLWQMQSGDLARLTSLWMQQVVGVQRQMLQEYQYSGVVEGSFDAEFARAYQGGGSLDLRKIDSISTIFGDSVFLGISQIVEAWMIGTDADIWGDIPYSQADSFFTYKTPVLDPQQQVYASIQTLLSQGIANLQTGAGVGPQGVDLVYGGDPAKWTALAHTLKARFYLHTAEQLGTPAYTNALAEANMGISSNDGDYIANFSGSQAAESNPWWQFVDPSGPTGRSGDLIGGPSFLSDLMTSLGDPRFADYFDLTSDSTSSFSIYRENTTYPQPYVTYNENLLIKAEAQLQTGAAGPALITLNQERAAWATATPWHRAYTLPPIGASSLNAIMTEKYIVLFQNVETWNDYKRTCIPNLTPVNGGDQNGVIPGRLLYPLQERQTNPNVPLPGQQPPRNWNDPNPCPAP